MKRLTLFGIGLATVAVLTGCAAPVTPAPDTSARAVSEPREYAFIPSACVQTTLPDGTPITVKVSGNVEHPSVEARYLENGAFYQCWGGAGILDDDAASEGSGEVGSTDSATPNPAPELTYVDATPVVSAPAASTSVETVAPTASSSTPGADAPVTVPAFSVDVAPSAPVVTATPTALVASGDVGEVGSSTHVEVVHHCLIDSVLWASVSAAVGCEDTFNLSVADVETVTADGGSLLPALAVEVWNDTYVDGVLVSSSRA